MTELKCALHLITCVSGSRVNSFSLVSLLILDSISLELWGEEKHFSKSTETGQKLRLRGFHSVVLNIRTFFFLSFSPIWKWGFIFYRLITLGRRAQRWESGGTSSTRYWAAHCNLSSCFPVTVTVSTSFHAHMALLFRTTQRWSSMKSFSLKDQISISGKKKQPACHQSVNCLKNTDVSILKKSF